MALIFLQGWFILSVISDALIPIFSTQWFVADTSHYVVGGILHPYFEYALLSYTGVFGLSSDNDASLALLNSF